MARWPEVGEADVVKVAGVDHRQRVCETADERLARAHLKLAEVDAAQAQRAVYLEQSAAVDGDLEAAVLEAHELVVTEHVAEAHV